MNTTMKWLLKREFWEHKGGFFWTPLVIGGIISVATIVSTIAGLVAKSKYGFQIDGQRVSDLGGQVHPEVISRFIEGLSQAYVMSAAPLFMAMTAVVFFFCLGNLFDERKDRSVLFWKSLPVSDAQTVVSKAAMALIAAPLLTLAIGVVTSVIVLLTLVAGAAGAGVNIAGVFGQAGTYTAPFALLATLPVYLVWALPTVGWLMMVSSWARTKVFLWAVGVPVLTGVLLSWFNAMFEFGWNVKWFWENIVARGLLSVAPGSWFAFVDPPGGVHLREENVVFLWPMVAQSWKTLASAHAAIGAAAGVGMLYAATRIRRWKDEG